MQKGFIIPIVPAVVVVLILAIGGVLYLNKVNISKVLRPTPFATITPSPAPLSSITSTKDDETANWKTYRSSKCGIEFQYPPQYKVVEQTLETLGRGCVQLQIPYRPKGQVFDLMIDFYRHLTFPTEDVEKCKEGEDITKGCAIDVKIGGVNGIEYNYGDMYRVIKVKNPELQINMNGGIFSRFYEEREKVNKILSSFKFTN